MRFRLGNVVHAIQATQQSIHVSDLVPRICLTIANLNRVIYFVCDTVLWVRSVGLVSHINKEKWRKWAARYYYYSLLLHIIRDVYEVSLQMEQAAQEKAKKEKLMSQNDLGPCIADEETEWLQSFFLLLFRSLRKHPPLFLDTVKNVCDILNPLDQLDIYKSNSGIIGLGGLLSSIVGIITVAYPQMRLKTC
ncbi:peroxisomal membrane protein 11A isoform X1 [Macrotis lagotis]|uniref:peroxisomal membrane protein 11A isoform X1 n=1 Tax=Macrotis lagotis TaxID=92651 RepID=UPI003D683C1F